MSHLELFGSQLGSFGSHVGPILNDMRPYGSQILQFQSDKDQFGSHLGVDGRDLRLLGSHLGVLLDNLGPILFSGTTGCSCIKFHSVSVRLPDLYKAPPM